MKEQTDVEIEETLKTNLFVPLTLTAALLRQQQHFGVINISSIEGNFPKQKNKLPYAVSKQGLNSFSQMIASQDGISFSVNVELGFLLSNFDRHMETSNRIQWLEKAGLTVSMDADNRFQFTEVQTNQFLEKYGDYVLNPQTVAQKITSLLLTQPKGFLNLEIKPVKFLDDNLFSK